VDATGGIDEFELQRIAPLLGESATEEEVQSRTHLGAIPG